MQPNIFLFVRLWVFTADQFSSFYKHEPDRFIYFVKVTDVPEWRLLHGFSVYRLEESLTRKTSVWVIILCWTHKFRWISITPSFRILLDARTPAQAASGHTGDGVSRKIHLPAENSVKIKIRDCSWIVLQHYLY